MPIRTLLAGVLCLFTMISAPKAEQLHALAAGSLREVLNEIGNQYRKTLASI
jgi:ABC-type molybdate transport system substrate-binding protein